MIYKYLLFLTIIIIGNHSMFPQIDKSAKTPKASENLIDNKKIITDQAVFILKNNLLNSKQIENFQQRTDVVTEASLVLWSYDKDFAKESLVAFIDQSLDNYAELLSKENKTEEESSTLKNLTYSLNKCLNALAKKDLKSAKLLQNRYFEIKKQNLDGKDLNESFDIAIEGLELDEQRTVNLLSSILQIGIPSQFPKLIFGLKTSHPEIAKILIQRAIQQVSINPNYRAEDVIYLSVAVFSEDGIIIPELRDSNNPNEFGIITSFIGKSSNSVGREIIISYFVPVQNFVNQRLQNQASGFFDSNQTLLRIYFLIEKLKSYNQKFGLNYSQELNSISIPITTLMQTAEFSQQTLLDIQGYAQRIANSNNPLGLDDGTGLLEKAENAKNPNEKLEFLIRAIIQFIESKQFDKAEKKIFDIENAEIRDSLYLFSNVYAGLDAIESKNWRAFEKRTEKIDDQRIKAFLYLKVISKFDAKSNKNNNLLSGFIIKAERNIKDISDKTAQASAYIFLTSYLLLLDQTDGNIMLPSAMKSINNAPDYDEQEYEINIIIPTRQDYYAKYLGANSFRDTFSILAEIDWNDAQIQSNQIKSKGLQAIAEITSAKAILKKLRLLK